jgi:hypothetical protein
VKDGLEEEAVPPSDLLGCLSTIDSYMTFTPFLLLLIALLYFIRSTQSIRSYKLRSESYVKNQTERLF